MTPDMRQGGALPDAAPSTISPRQATDLDEDNAAELEARNIDLADALDAVFAGTTAPRRTRPTLLELEDDDRALLYTKRVNWLSGTTGSGKTWIGAVLVASVLTEGGLAAYLDCERDAVTFIARLRALGVTRDAIAAGLTYHRPYSRTEWNRAIGDLLGHADTGLDALVIDGVGEALALGDVNANDGGDVKAWVRTGPAKLARLTGASVVCIDHLGRAGGDTPAGSFHKHDTVDGVAYVLETERRLTPGGRGVLALRNVKDALGGIDAVAPRGTIVGRIVLDATNDDGVIEWAAVRDASSARPSATESAEQPAPRVTAPAERREDVLAAVSRVLEVAPEALSRNKIEKAAGGTAAWVRDALEVLVREGYVARDEVPAKGAGKPTHRHRLLKPYGDPAARSSSPPLRGVGGRTTNGVPTAPTNPSTNPDEPPTNPTNLSTDTADEPPTNRRRPTNPLAVVR